MAAYLRLFASYLGKADLGLAPTQLWETQFCAFYPRHLRELCFLTPAPH